MTRIKKLKNILPRLGVDFLIIENPIDVFYLTGFNFSRARLVIGQHKEVLFLDGRYIDEVKDQFSCESLTDKNLKSFLGDSKSRVGFDSIFTNVQDFTTYKALFSSQITLVPLKNPLKESRMVKDPGEILLLKQSAVLNKKAYEHALPLLQIGVTEKEIAREIEFFFRNNGAEKLAFAPIVSFGERTAYPHYVPGDIPLKENESVLIDMGCVYKGYYSDMTRMVFFPGVKKEILDIFSHVKKSHEIAIALCKPGTRLGEVDEAVHTYFKDVKMDHLMKHSLGHGVGLEIHEAPSVKFDGIDRDIILKPSMVFTIEPGLYKKGLGGVRYEDTILITSDGNENFYD